MEHSRLIFNIQETAGYAETCSTNNSSSGSSNKGTQSTTPAQSLPSAASVEAVAFASTATSATASSSTAETVVNKNDTRPLVVADMMAGVGPFAVPLAMPLPFGCSTRRSIIVHANDLNPASFKYLEKNAKTNNCGKRLFNYNMDGRFEGYLTSLF